jgi:hypothetical protein
MFNFTPTTTAPVSNDADDLFSMFATPRPTSNANTNAFIQPTQQQPNFMNFTPVSPIAPPTVTSPFAQFDLLG